MKSSDRAVGCPRFEAHIERCPPVRTEPVSLIVVEAPVPQPMTMRQQKAHGPKQVESRAFEQFNGSRPQQYPFL
ncbi:MAG: hypothetical protein ACPGKS_09500 [Coraliomargarita sp.]